MLGALAVQPVGLIHFGLVAGCCSGPAGPLLGRLLLDPSVAGWLPSGVGNSSCSVEWQVASSARPWGGHLAPPRRKGLMSVVGIEPD